MHGAGENLRLSEKKETLITILNRIGYEFIHRLTCFLYKISCLPNTTSFISVLNTVESSKCILQVAIE